jgi:hypothetical protein
LNHQFDFPYQVTPTITYQKIVTSVRGVFESTSDVSCYHIFVVKLFIIYIHAPNLVVLCVKWCVKEFISDVRRYKVEFINRGNFYFISQFCKIELYPRSWVDPWLRHVVVLQFLGKVCNPFEFHKTGLKDQSLQLCAKDTRFTPNFLKEFV